MNIWIMRKIQGSSHGRGDRRFLVRADAITYLSGDDDQVRASQLGSDEFSVIADVKDGGPTAPKLPDGFNVDLLFAISEARRRAQEDNGRPAPGRPCPGRPDLGR
ncbi:hypothetical protein Shyd_60340 [Streptomyces hydrogenans]|uniref:Uncharacterized protein n=1 Tax=Streptomyces hydrogenans TaxID=1873719 RepID=A0ABQ3PI13_9ACTN|nr:hypothetical protein [Streptomyces hydrogenans]GHI24663.1 hypothetical protein Shyd_60340 [Streptomyces hydrogenans]